MAAASNRLADSCTRCSVHQSKQTSHQHHQQRQLTSKGYFSSSAHRCQFIVFSFHCNRLFNFFFSLSLFSSLHCFILVVDDSSYRWNASHRRWWWWWCGHNAPSFQWQTADRVHTYVVHHISNEHPTPLPRTIVAHDISNVNCAHFSRMSFSLTSSSFFSLSFRAYDIFVSLRLNQFQVNSTQWTILR